MDAYTYETFEGAVNQIRMKATTTSNVVKYTVIISAPNPDLKLFPGMTANVTIITEEETGLAVPAEALNFTPDEQVLRTMQKPEKPSESQRPPMGEMPRWTNRKHPALFGSKRTATLCHNLSKSA